jgi:hypothetical protein
MICKKIFISSTTSDLEQYRNEASELITELNDQYQGKCQLIPVFMDNQAHNGRIQTPTQRSTGWVKDCDWVVLIVGWHYGHVPKNDTKSVTESEYREAVSRDMPIFVFMPGEHYDGQKAYRALPKDRELNNLADWKPIKLLENKGNYSSAISEFEDEEKLNFEALGKFKAELRNNGCDLFTDIDHFLKLLNKALIKQVDNTLKTPQTTPPVNVKKSNNELLIELHTLKSQIRNCLDQINLLAILKRIHDRLHAIRQFGIRRWREEVNNQWIGDNIPQSAKDTYTEGLLLINDARASVESYLYYLPEQNELNSLKGAIKKVIEMDFKNIGTKQKFQEDTRLYATRVQAAFKYANKAMYDKANNLQVCKFLNQPTLTINNEDSEFIAKIATNLNDGHIGLKSLFTEHNDWQELHDLMEKIDSTKENINTFSDDLIELIDDPEKVEQLISHARKIAETHPKQEKEDWKKNIDAIDLYFKQLSEEKSVSVYERMRKNFDDLFFKVDHDVLVRVEQSTQCAQQNFDAVGTRIDQINKSNNL